MTRVHFIYPHGPCISAPDTIGRNIGKRLNEQGYDVLYYDWDSVESIKPGQDDVLLGHPHPFPWTIFNRSIRNKGWKRVIALAPYSHGMPNAVAHLEKVISYCDLFLAITGNYWFSGISESLYAHWLPKMIHVDLAVDRTDFPVIKHRFNRPGQRTFLYIGGTSIYKNTTYLAHIAKRLPGMMFSWIGRGKPIPGVKALGYLDFSDQASREVVASHDFLITVGRSDANPTTVLEAMAWGLIPICTPESGYINYPGIINVPLDNLDRVAEILEWLQILPEQKLKKLQILNWQLLDTHFNWDRVAEQIVQAIHDDASPVIEKASCKQRLTIQWHYWTSPYSFLAPRNTKHTTRSLLSLLQLEILSRF
ncbi:MAG: glycosyltransferase family 4 protein [Anaerolineae bacterium]|nr:glycosyltransferase family 4 protein [Anaerolineae bacterium]